MSTKKYAIDLQLHIEVKVLAIMDGEINCKLDELFKKTKLLQDKEKEGKEANYLLEIISDNLNELSDLFKQINNLCNQIENPKRNERDIMKE